MIAQQNCVDGAPALDDAAIAALLKDIPDWRVTDAALVRRYQFPNWQATLAFVNAVARMVEQQNHHPLLTMTYTYCELRFTTHSAGNATSMNDVICAARADAIYRAAP